MDPEHLRALRDNRVQLVHGTKHIPTILDYLVQDNIITEQDEQQVQEKDGPNQIRKLLAILPSKGDKAFQSFCQALERTGHGGLAKRLSGDLERTGQNVIFDQGSAEYSRSHEQNSNTVSVSTLRDHLTVNRPTRKKGERVFIVHAGGDKDSFVRPLVQTLQEKGFPQEDIFYDELSITTGQVIRDRIMSALASDSMEVVVIVASKSLLNHKYWPKLELETALRHNKRLYPIWLDDNQDSFKEFSSLVGQYCPTLKQIRADCVQTSKISEETTAIASELMSMVSCSIVLENDSHTTNEGSSMTTNSGRFVTEVPDMSQCSTQSGPTTSHSQLSSRSSSSVMLSDAVEAMWHDQFDAQKETASVSCGVMNVGQDVTQPGPSMSSLQECNGQSLVQSCSIVDVASGEENLMQRMQGEIRTTHEVPGNQHQLAERQHANRKQDSPSMSPSRLLDIDIDTAIEIVVASIISDEWRTLLHHLGLSEQELETLQNKETPEAACEAGLKLWRETRGQEVTTERLVRAVKDTKVKLQTGTDQKIKLKIRERENTCMEEKAILLDKLKEMITKDVLIDAVFDQTMERYQQLKSEVMDNTINEKGKSTLLHIINELFTETVLHDEKRFKETMRKFHKVKAEIRELCKGSVLCKLRFYRRKSQVEFVSACKDGTLSAILTEEYITQELVEICGGMPLYIHIEVDEEDFQRAAHFFHGDPPSHGGQSPPLCPVGQGAAHTTDTPQVEPMDTQDSPTVSLIPRLIGSDSMEESVHPAVVPESQWSEVLNQWRSKWNQ
ncbi:uncharacterized protein [Branchiostoma lanceolatum]|uniref:uncharacterized protein isoform X2 n=1 Tax=Branchiostoma lanceolatum TaxID=7740 RepID=UPI003454E976